MFVLTSSELIERGLIPLKYANAAWGAEGGQNLSPPLNWSGAPPGTKSFALGCVDADLPLDADWFPFKDQIQPGGLPGDLFIHWVACDIAASVSELSEGASPGKMPSGICELMTSFGESGYGGPAPPKGHKAHAYVFTLYALNVDSLGLAAEAGYGDFVGAMRGRVIATASLTAYFGHY